MKAAPKRLLDPKRLQRDLDLRVSDLEITAREVLRITHPPRSISADEPLYNWTTPLYDGIFEHSIQRLIATSVSRSNDRVVQAFVRYSGLIVAAFVLNDAFLWWMLRR